MTHVYFLPERKPGQEYVPVQVAGIEQVAAAAAEPEPEPAPPAVAERSHAEARSGTHSRRHSLFMAP
jgi:hypothetical protein